MACTAEVAVILNNITCPVSRLCGQEQEAQSQIADFPNIRREPELLQGVQGLGSLSTLAISSCHRAQDPDRFEGCTLYDPVDRIRDTFDPTLPWRPVTVDKSSKPALLVVKNYLGA